MHNLTIGIFSGSEYPIQRFKVIRVGEIMGIAVLTVEREGGNIFPFTWRVVDGTDSISEGDTLVYNHPYVYREGPTGWPDQLWVISGNTLKLLPKEEEGE